ncbi:MAG: type II toxin-antitoxin system RelE/ParE family toxin [Halioglobus sp.]|nr:type II toxin-antitoxin system RelE/ParE family toxin [Halioglobus sp.]
MERSPGRASAPTSRDLITIHIEPAALSDIEGASDWYELQRPGLGTELHTSSVDRLLEQAGSNPEAYVQVYREFRRALLRRFPYAIYFILRNGTLRVQAVLHQNRSEEVISSRLA